MQLSLSCWLLLTLLAGRGAPAAAAIRTQNVNGGQRIEDVFYDVTDVEHHHRDTDIDSRPNIIFIFIDDAGYDDFGYQSSDLSWSQPNIIQAAREEGIILSSYYTEPHCTPARSAFLTGKYAVNVGMTVWDVMTFSPFGLPTEHTTIANYLKDLGYQTHQIGKWDVGHYKNEYLPNARGFDTFHGFMGPGLASYSTRKMYKTFSGVDRVANLATWDWLRGNQDGWWLGEARYANASYSTDYFTDLAIEKIEDAANGTEPLFIYLNYQAVHSSIEAGIEDFEDIPEITNLSIPVRRIMAAAWMGLDANFNRLKRALEDNGIVNNTIIIMASDNGGCPGVGGSVLPLRGAKTSLFEGGVHVPSFIWSRLIPEEKRGTVYNHLFHVSDWLPTIYAMAGGDPSLLLEDDLDGVNQWAALLDGNQDPPRTEALMSIDAWALEWSKKDSKYEIFPAQQPLMAYRDGDYKLIMNHECDGYYGMSQDGKSVTCHNELTAQVCSDGSTAKSCSMTSGGKYCGVFNKPGNHFLFNIREDPLEQFNLYGHDSYAKDVTRKISNKLWKVLLKAPYPAFDYPSIDDRPRIANEWRRAGGYVVPWDN